MLDREVAKTPKFEKLLGEEMGEKSAYEMRVSDNAYRNNNGLSVKIIDVSKRAILADLKELKGKEGRAGFNRGIFTNSFTGIDIIYGRNSIKESVTKAMQDRQHKFDTDARICALYQMNELIENAIFFDSQLSEYGKGAKLKSQNTLFMHKMYSVFRYNEELYLAKLSVEEFNYKTPEKEIEHTSNRFYNLRNIKITPTKLPGLTPGADL